MLGSTPPRPRSRRQGGSALERAVRSVTATFLPASSEKGDPCDGNQHERGHSAFVTVELHPHSQFN